MRSVLFHAFFSTLENDNIHVSIRDYARIRTLFAIRRDWTLDGIRESLKSLLAHDPAKRRAFDRHFRAFFHDSQGHGSIGSVEISRAVTELKTLRPQGEPNLTPSPQPLSESIWHPSKKDEPKCRLRKPLVIVGAVIVILLLSLLTKRPTSITKLPLRFEPASVDFGNHEGGSVTNKEVKLINNGQKRLTITSITLAGEHKEDFELAGANTTRKKILNPGANYAIGVGFAPKKVEMLERRAELVIRIEGEENPFKVPLAGGITDDQGPPPNFQSPSFTIASKTQEGLPASFTIRTQLIERTFVWVFWLVVGIICLITAVSFGLYLLRWRKPPQDLPAKSRENTASERFSFADVGGIPEPILPTRQVKVLADMLGFVHRDERIPCLDLARTVDATIRAGGIPKLRYDSLYTTRDILILEDTFTHADFRSAIVEDLCLGLQETGVAFQRFRFAGQLDRMMTMKGTAIELADLEQDRDKVVVLLFSDGGGFSRHPGPQFLQQLAEWPRVAWLHLKESKLRTATDAELERLGIRVFPATPSGLQDALYSFIIQGPVSQEEDVAPMSADHTLYRSDMTHDAYAERLLGDALMLAADCCLFQPCSKALAERLRRRFHAHLPHTRIQRIYRLPGLQRDGVGLNFDYETQRFLRRTWLNRRHPQDQQNVLKFIKKELEKAKPATISSDSLAYLTWEAGLERVRLELEPDTDLKRFAELASSPVGRFMKASIQGCHVPGGNPPKGDREIPLRLIPNDPRAQQRLAGVDRNIGIPRLKALPLKFRHWVGLIAPVLLGMVCLFLAWSTWQEEASWPKWTVIGKGAERLLLWAKTERDEQFRQIGHWGSAQWTRHAPIPDRSVQYRIELTELARKEQSIPKNHAVQIVLTSEKTQQMEMKWIPPGTFAMGSPDTEKDRDKDETLHQVTLTQGYFLGETEVTQAQYKKIMGRNPSRFSKSGINAPVETVSWEEATEFCTRLNKQEKEKERLPAGWEYRLPTEAQWEYACRAGTSTRFHTGDNDLDLDKAAWFYSNSENKTHEVKKKAPNDFGLYDMHGNVWEWCLDNCDYDVSTLSVVTDTYVDGIRDPLSTEGSERVVRGGSWDFNAGNCRSANRSRYAPDVRGSNLGFRVAVVQSSEVRKRDQTAVEGRHRDLVMVRIEPGAFTMGSPEDEPGRWDDEKQHRVRLTKPFYLCKYEVTQRLYQDVMATENPSYFKHAGEEAPVENVSWEEAMKFCEVLTEKHQSYWQLPEGYVFTLPTEAQWEYACRASTTGAIYKGKLEILGSRNAPALDSIAWYGGNSGVEYEGGYDSSGWGEKQYGHNRAGTHPVGRKVPNKWGLHDMLGNVWEWCWDWYDAYPNEATDPTGPPSGSLRVVRGGGWFNFAGVCRSANRLRFAPDDRFDILGFRVAAVQRAEFEQMRRRDDGK